MLLLLLGRERGVLSAAVLMTKRASVAVSHESRRCIAREVVVDGRKKRERG